MHDAAVLALPAGPRSKGIKAAGYKFVAWGTTHKEDGKDVPVLAKDASPEKAKELAKRCRDLGLEPVLMFSGIYPEAKDGFEVLKQRHPAGRGRGRAAGAHLRPHQGRQPGTLGRAVQEARPDRARTTT